MDLTCSHCGGARHAGAPPSGCFIALRTYQANQADAIKKLEERGGFSELGEALLRSSRTLARLLRWLGLEFPGDPKDFELPALSKDGWLHREHQQRARIENRLEALEARRSPIYPWHGCEGGACGGPARCYCACHEKDRPPRATVRCQHGKEIGTWTSDGSLYVFAECDACHTQAAAGK